MACQINDSLAKYCNKLLHNFEFVYKFWLSFNVADIHDGKMITCLQPSNSSEIKQMTVANQTFTQRYPHLRVSYKTTGSRQREKGIHVIQSNYTKRAKFIFEHWKQLEDTTKKHDSNVHYILSKNNSSTHTEYAQQNSRNS